MIPDPLKPQYDANGVMVTATPALAAPKVAPAPQSPAPPSPASGDTAAPMAPAGGAGIPPPPPGFVLDQPPAAASAVPHPPPGFILDTPVTAAQGAVPPPPPGFTLDQSVANPTVAPGVTPPVTAAQPRSGIVANVSDFGEQAGRTVGGKLYGDVGALPSGVRAKYQQGSAAMAADEVKTLQGNINAAEEKKRQGLSPQSAGVVAQPGVIESLFGDPDAQQARIRAAQNAPYNPAVDEPYIEGLKAKRDAAIAKRDAALASEVGNRETAAGYRAIEQRIVGPAPTTTGGKIGQFVGEAGVMAAELAPAALGGPAGIIGTMTAQEAGRAGEENRPVNLAVPATTAVAMAAAGAAGRQLVERIPWLNPRTGTVIEKIVKNAATVPVKAAAFIVPEVAEQALLENKTFTARELATQYLKTVAMFAVMEVPGVALGIRADRAKERRTAEYNQAEMAYNRTVQANYELLKSLVSEGIAPDTVMAMAVAKAQGNEKMLAELVKKSDAEALTAPTAGAEPPPLPEAGKAADVAAVAALAVPGAPIAPETPLSPVTPTIEANKGRTTADLNAVPGKGADLSNYKEIPNDEITNEHMERIVSQLAIDFGRARDSVSLSFYRPKMLHDVPDDPRVMGTVAAGQIAKVFGKDLIYFKANVPINGFNTNVLKDKILISVDSPRPELAVFGHELIHEMRSDAPELHKSLTAELGQYVKDFGDYPRRGTNPSMTEKDLVGDFIPDVAGDQFIKPEFWKTLQDKNPTLFGKVADYVMRFIQKVQEKLSSVYGTEKNFLPTDLEKVRSILADHLNRYAQSKADPGKGAAQPISPVPVVPGTPPSGDASATVPLPPKAGATPPTGQGDSTAVPQLDAIQRKFAVLHNPAINATKPMDNASIASMGRADLIAAAKSTMYGAGDSVWDALGSHSNDDLRAGLKAHKAWYNEASGKPTPLPLSDEAKAAQRAGGKKSLANQQDAGVVDNAELQAAASGDRETINQIARASGKSEPYESNPSASVQVGDTFMREGNKHTVTGETDTGLTVKDSRGEESIIPFEQEQVLMDRESWKRADGSTPEVVDAVDAGRVEVDPFMRPGPGAMSADSAETSDGQTRTTKAYIETTQRQLGFDVNETVPKHDADLIAEAARTLQETKGRAGIDLIAELKANPRGTSDKERLLLLHEVKVREESLNNAIEEGNRLAKSGDEGAIAANAKDQLTRSAGLQDAFQASGASGSEAGRALRAIRFAMNEDYSIARMTARAKAQSGGKWTPEQEVAHLAEIQKLHAEYKAKFDAAEKVAKDSEAAAVAKATAESAAKGSADFQKYVKELVNRGAKRKPWSESALKFIDAEADAAMARIKERRSHMQSGIDPTELADYAVVGAKHLAHGAYDFAVWSGKMRTAIGDFIMPHLKTIWNKARLIVGEKGVEDKEGKLGKGAELPGVGGGSTEKDKAQSFGKLVKEMVENEARNGVKDYDTAIKNVHEILKDGQPDLTTREVGDAYSDYGKYRKPTADEIKMELQDWRRIGQLQSALEDVMKKEPPQRTGQGRNPPSQKVRDLTKQLHDAMKKMGIAVRDPEAQLKSSLDAVKTRLTNSIADLETALATKTRMVANKSGVVYDAEANALKAQRDELRAQYDEIFPKAPLTDAERYDIAVKSAQKSADIWAQRLADAKRGIFDAAKAGKRPPISGEAYAAIRAQRDAAKAEYDDLAQTDLTKLKQRIAKRTAELNAILASGKAAPKPVRKEIQLDAEANRAQAELDHVKEKIEVMMEKIRIENMTVFQKAGHVTSGVYDAARLIMTTGELSYILRQGKMEVMGHPIRTVKALPNMFRALFGSRITADALDLQVFNHPEAKRAIADGLALAKESARLSKQDEIVMGRLGNVMPIVRNFNQAARVFLNKIRFDAWLALNKSLSESGAATKEESQQFAKFVNESTGRGGLGFAEPASVPLARILFSPRYWASRIELAVGHSMWYGTGRSRKLIATEYARSLIGLGVYYSMLYGGLSLLRGKDDKKVTLGKNMLSTTFGKITKGDTTLDPLAGLSQNIVFIARTMAGAKVNGKGVLEPIRGNIPYGKDNWKDVAADYTWSKVHPVVGFAANMLSGSDMVGREASLANQSGNMLMPITYADIYRALKEQDLPTGTVLSLLAVLGEGLQTFDREEQRRSQRASRNDKRLPIGYKTIKQLMKWPN